MNLFKVWESNLVMDGSQHTVSDMVVHNISSYMLLLGSGGAWQPFAGGEGGQRVNMLALVCLSTAIAQADWHANKGIHSSTTCWMSFTTMKRAMVMP